MLGKEPIMANIKNESIMNAISEAKYNIMLRKSELEVAMEQLKKFSELYCTGCRYCQPCPAGIEIPRIFNMYTHHNVYGLTDHAKRMYDQYLKQGGKLREACLDCGYCERKCPQHLNIRQELDKVEALLKTL